MFTDQGQSEVSALVHPCTMDRGVDSPSFACGMCGKCFSDAEQCRLHIQSHTGQQPFRCVICWPLFYNMSNSQQSGSSATLSQPSGPSLATTAHEAKAVTSSDATAKPQTAVYPQNTPALQTAASSEDGAAASPSAVTAEAPELLHTVPNNAVVSSGCKKATSGDVSQNVASGTTSTPQNKAHAVPPTIREGASVGITFEEEPPGTSTFPQGIPVPQVSTFGISTRTSSESVGVEGDFPRPFQTPASAACSSDEGSKSEPVARIIAGDSLPASAAGTSCSAAPSPEEDSVSVVKAPSSLMGSSPVTVEINPVPQYSVGDPAVNPCQLPTEEAADGPGESNLSERTLHSAGGSDQSQVEPSCQAMTTACEKNSSCAPDAARESLAYRGRRKKGTPKRLIGDMPVQAYMAARLHQEAAILNDHIYSSLSREDVAGIDGQHRSTEVQPENEISEAENSEDDKDQHNVPKLATAQEAPEKNVCLEESQTQKIKSQEPIVQVCSQDTQGQRVTLQEANSSNDNTHTKKAPVNFQGVISFLRSVQVRNPPGNEAQSSLASRSRDATRSTVVDSRAVTPDSTTSPYRGNASPGKVSSAADSHILSSSVEDRMASSLNTSVEKGRTRPQDASAEERTSSQEASVEGTIAGPQDASTACESPHAALAEGRSSATETHAEEGPLRSNRDAAVGTVDIVPQKRGNTCKAAGLEASRGGPPAEAQVIKGAGHGDNEGTSGRPLVMVTSHYDTSTIIGNSPAHPGPSAARTTTGILKDAGNQCSPVPGADMAEAERQQSSSSPTRTVVRGEPTPQAIASFSKDSGRMESNTESNASAVKQTSSHTPGAGITAIPKDSATDTTTHTRSYSTAKTASKASASNATKKSISPAAPTDIEIVHSPAVTASSVKPTSAVTIQPVQAAEGGPVVQANLTSNEIAAIHPDANKTFVHITPPLPPSTVPATSVVAGDASAVPQVGSPSGASRSSDAAETTPTGFVSASAKVSCAVPSLCTADQLTSATSTSSTARSVSSATSTWNETSTAVSTIHVNGNYSTVVPAVSLSLDLSSTVPICTAGGGTPTVESSSRNPSPGKAVAKASTSPTAIGHSPRSAMQENTSHETVQGMSAKSLAVSKVTIKNPYVSLAKIRAPALDDLYAGKTIHISLNEPFKQSPFQTPACTDSSQSPNQNEFWDSSLDVDEAEPSDLGVSESDETVPSGDEESLPDPITTMSGFRESNQPNRSQNDICLLGPLKTTEQSQPQKGQSSQDHTVASPGEALQSAQAEKETNSYQKSSHSVSTQDKSGKPQSSERPGSPSTQTKTSHTSKISKSKTSHNSQVNGRCTIHKNGHQTTQDAVVQSTEKQRKTLQNRKTAEGLTDGNVGSRNVDVNSSHKPVSSTAVPKDTGKNTQRKTEGVRNRLQPASKAEQVNLEPLSAKKSAHTQLGPQTTQSTETGEMAVNAQAAGSHFPTSLDSRKRPAKAGVDEQKCQRKKRRPRMSAEKLVLVYPEVQLDLQELFTPVHKLRHRSSEHRDTTDAENSSRDSAHPVSFCSRYGDENSLNASDLPVTSTDQIGKGEDRSSLATRSHCLGGESNSTFPSAPADSIFEEDVDLPPISKPRRKRLQEKSNARLWDRSNECPEKSSDHNADKGNSGEHIGVRGKSGEHRRDEGGECHRPAHARPSATVTSPTVQRRAPTTVDRETLRNCDSVLQTGVDITSFTMFSTQGGSLSSSSIPAAPQSDTNVSCKRPTLTDSETVKFRNRKQQIEKAKMKKLKIKNRQSATETSETSNSTAASPQIFTPSVAESVKRAESRRRSALHHSPDLETTTAQLAESIAASVLSEISPLATNGQMRKRKKAVKLRETSKVRTKRMTLYRRDSVYISPGRFNHGKVSQYECKKCDAKFKKYSNYRLHLKNHGKDRFACEVCGNTFGRRESLKTHRMIHTGEASIDCTTCGKTLSGLASLTTHMRIHTDERPYSCPLCPRTFRQQSALTSHYRVHTGDRPFKCNVCSKSYRFQKNLYNHRFTHTGERRYVCSICSASYYQVSALNVHLKVHTGERPFACQLCSMRFIQKAHLAKHLRNLHQDEVQAVEEREAKNASKPYKCGSCGQIFTSLFSKGRHVKLFCTAIFASCDMVQAEPTQ